MAKVNNINPVCIDDERCSFDILELPLCNNLSIILNEFNLIECRLSNERSKCRLTEGWRD